MRESSGEKWSSFSHPAAPKLDTAEAAQRGTVQQDSAGMRRESEVVKRQLSPFLSLSLSLSKAKEKMR